MQTIGFIGIGIMGKPMVKNLLKAGFTVHVYARRPDVLTDLIALGALPEKSLVDLAQAANVIITNVNNTVDVEEILVGSFGIIHTAKPDTVVIDMSTISAQATVHLAKQLAVKNIAMLDAPVSGGEQGAIDGTLSIMVGGKSSVLISVMPILTVLGQRITHIGDHGAGQVAKSCNQIIVAENIIAVSEALKLATASGVDASKVREALMGGFAGSKILEVHGQRMLEANYKPGFKAKLHKKDMQLALDEAKRLKLDLPAAKYAKNCIDALVEHGDGELDSAAIHVLN